MKKIKIMMLSLSLLAIVGGALAFKAKVSFKYCTSVALQGTCGSPVFTCPDAVNSTTTNNPNDGVFVCYTSSNTYTVGPNAADVKHGCFYNSADWQNGDYRTSTITCATTQRLKFDN